MIVWIKTWIQGIIFAVIVSTIIEMIIPENKNKKYIKVVIGIYIVYVIIGPIISKVSGKELKIDLKKYTENTNQMAYSSIDISNSLTEAYIENLKQDIKEKIYAKGYTAESIELKINESSEKYGEILQMKIKIKENKINSIEIEPVNISNKNENKLENNDYSDLKLYLSNEYEAKDIEIFN